MERLADRMGRWLASEFDWTPEQQEVATFSLVLVVSTSFTLLLILLLSWAAGVLAEALIMAGTSALLRMFGGGAHLSGGWRCGWASALAVTGMALVAHGVGPVVGSTLGMATPWVLPVTGLAVAVVMARLAPVPAPEKPIRSERRRRSLRALAIAVSVTWGGAWAVILSLREVQPALWLASAFGLFQETLSVTPSGGRAARWLDRTIAQVFMKGGETA
ncbi:accessory gene regulator ArgB-like protein [Limnochorda pilosa]|uniref:Accessory gene regulator B n=1 Tax=Limnochorda pilosa TaxID=1555112 RepID=A0A0K2SHH0_LIMPI|nr:accessory gene regulator B family protein [Limnochorda pilosa]BAS26558.1 accessory gene regulator B [Limnochorda pilosa]